jgi:ribosomal protein S27AE
MFIYCEKCGWTQDDFWSNIDEESYNPFTYVNQFKEEFFKHQYELDDIYYNEGLQQYSTNREYYANLFERMANTIRKQKYIDIKQYKLENPSKLCPECGGHLIED